MESKELKRVIDKHLFVPIDEGIAERLHEVTLSMTNKIDVGIMESCVCDFFSNNVNAQFRGVFETTYKNKYGEDLHLSYIVYVILEAYYVSQALMSDGISESQKLQLSYMVKNYAVKRKGSWNQLLCPDWILTIYEYNNHHKYKPGKHTSYSQLINAVVKSKDWSATGLEISNQEIYNQLRSLCISGNRGNLNSYVKSSSFCNVVSPFAKVYILVVKMVKEWQWKYVDASPIVIICEVLGDESKKRKNLNNIADEVIANVPPTDIYNPNMKSSILLRRIAENQNIGMEAIKFSVLEFGTYLYNELLLETIND